jgi:molybdate transport system substrate-binding protein
MEQVMDWSFSGRQAVLAAIAAFALTAPAAAAEITIYSGGAVKSALVEAASRYEKQRGTKITIEFHPMGPLTGKLAEGASPDIVVLTREVMDHEEKKPALAGAAQTEVGRVAIGVAVREGAPAPDISTPEAFKNALLAAKSIVYIDPTRGTSGKHLAAVFEQLGIAEAIKPKTTLGSGGYVVEPVGKGEVELGIHQITEILPVPGVKLVGPLPAALQKETVYVGAVTKSARNPKDAQDFLAYLRIPETRAVFAERASSKRHEPGIALEKLIRSTNSCRLCLRPPGPRSWSYLGRTGHGLRYTDPAQHRLRTAPLPGADGREARQLQLPAPARRAVADGAVSSAHGADRRWPR